LCSPIRSTTCAQAFAEIGGEWRRFYNNNFTLDTGTFTFANFNNFIAGNAASFSVTLGDRSSAIAQVRLAFTSRTITSGDQT